MQFTYRHWYLLCTALVALTFASASLADATVTRTLSQMVTVPADGSVKVENLVGHMTVTQSSGPVNLNALKGTAAMAAEMPGSHPLQVTATVVAGGSDAEALAQSVKLEVTTSGNQVTVHVHYPVDQYRSYLYNPPRTSTMHSDCFLEIFCVRGNMNSGVNYQDTNVQVNENGHTGTPLYVNVAVQLPAGVNAEFANARGVLEASNLTNRLSLNTQRGDISVQNLNGNLTATTEGADLLGTNLKGAVDVKTDGGDADLKTLSGTLRASTDGGDLQVSGDLTALSTLYARTDGGDLRVSGDLPALRTLDAGTDGGDAVFHVANLSMHLEVSSDGGDVNVHLPDLGGNVVSKDDYFSGDIGKSAGTGTIDSDGGDISISGD